MTGYMPDALDGASLPGRFVIPMVDRVTALLVNRPIGVVRLS